MLEISRYISIGVLVYSCTDVFTLWKRGNSIHSRLGRYLVSLSCMAYKLRSMISLIHYFVIISLSNSMVRFINLDDMK